MELESGIATAAAIMTNETKVGMSLDLRKPFMNGSPSVVLIECRSLETVE
jgi:hypothetical protein